MYFNEDTSDRMMYDLVSRSYDRARPEYPDAAFDEIFGRFSHKPTTLEIGSGSGQATATLARRSSRIDCVEPGENFVRCLNSKFDGDESVSIHQCDFEKFDTSTSYDLVFAGCALHWIPADVALTRVNRVLSRGGWLAGIWHQMRVDREISAVLDDVIVPFMSEFVLPYFHDEDREIFASNARSLSEAYGYSSCFVEIYEEKHELEIDEFVDLVQSYSDVTGWAQGDIENLFGLLRQRIAETGRGAVQLDYFFPMALISKSN